MVAGSELMRSRSRGVDSVPVPPKCDDDFVEGRRWIAAIGIDEYGWKPLNNAVSDVRGVVGAFKDLGFECVEELLLNQAATRDAIWCLPSNMRPKLQMNDTLVVFFAGHGSTIKWRYDGLSVDRGYLIPVDADPSENRYETWQRLDHWLSTIAELPARHILVVLDSCHSGIALSREMVHRELGAQDDALIDPLRQHRSRRVITSALGHQSAMDGGGPIAGHSVFTGFLVQALRGEASARFGNASVTGAELGYYLRSQVHAYSGRHQTPAVGVLEFDDQGDLLLSLPPVRRRKTISPGRGTPASVEFRADQGTQPLRDLHPRKPRPAQVPPSEREELALSRTEGWTLDARFAAKLDWQDEERKRGASVLTVISGDAMAAQISWGTWAARHGYLVLSTESCDLDGAVADLLGQTPWLRCLSEARKRVAASAGIDVEAVDASLDARGESDRRQWLEDVTGGNLHARVGGWLLTALRGPSAAALDLDTSPVKRGQLLAVACDLASPTAVLLHHPTPNAAWLERAIATGAALMQYLPRHTVAVTAPDELVSRVLEGQRRGPAMSLARQGLVKLEVPAQRVPGRARHSTMRALFDALEQDRRTRGKFELDCRIPTIDPAEPSIEVELVAHRARIAVELDGWYHFYDPEGYRRDRVQDLRLACAGYFVLRFPAEDVDDRLASTVDHIAIALAGRRGSAALY
jgi:hypothetical protein